MTRSTLPLKGPHGVVLEPHEAHVWNVPDSLVFDDDNASDCLSEHERQRAARLISLTARSRFSVTRTALRNILSLYTATPAASIEITTGERGKPFLPGRPDIHFSLSHAREIALVAVAHAAIGVDIEYSRQPRNIERVARRVLHERTTALLLRLPAASRPLAFLDAWTQREAHVKAVGGGLFHTPDSLPFDPDAPRDGTVRSVVDRAQADSWSVAHFEPAIGFHAAVVVRGRIDRLRFLEWERAGT